MIAIFSPCCHGCLAGYEAHAAQIRAQGECFKATALDLQTDVEIHNLT